jgi:hypothetical protein
MFAYWLSCLGWLRTRLIGGGFECELSLRVNL